MQCECSFYMIQFVYFTNIVFTYILSVSFDSQYFFFYSSLKSKKDWCIKIRCLSSCYQKISLYFNLYSIIFFIFMWVPVKLTSKKLVAFDHIIWSIYRMKSLSIAIERSFYYLSFDVEIIVIFDYFYINLHPWKSNPNGTGYRYWERSLCVSFESVS